MTPRPPDDEGAPLRPVVVQVSIDPGLAAELAADAQVLGLDGVSGLVREGVLMVHRRARERDAAAEIAEFYGSQPAPLPDGVAEIYGE
jgi:hypothetical protein